MPEITPESTQKLAKAQTTGDKQAGELSKRYQFHIGKMLSMFLKSTIDSNVYQKCPYYHVEE